MRALLADPVAPSYLLRSQRRGTDGLGKALAGELGLLAGSLVLLPNHQADSRGDQGEDFEDGGGLAGAVSQPLGGEQFLLALGFKLLRSRLLLPRFCGLLRFAGGQERRQQGAGPAVVGPTAAASQLPRSKLFAASVR